MFDAVELRKSLHKIPELAFEEFKTRDLLLSVLAQMPAQDSFRIVRCKNSTGLLVEYRGNKSAKAYLLFRADMDALPSEEQTSCSYRSEHPGLMHACGHDVHMAVLMGLINRVLLQKPGQNLLFLFQPAEEGKGGAQSIIRENILQQYDIRAAFALHVGSDLPVGTISSKPGIFFGIPQEFDLSFYGKAAHVAFPEKGVNALACGMDFYHKIMRDVASLNLEERVIFHVGKMSAGIIRNIIADKCVLEGTHRTLSARMRDRVNQLIEKHAGQSADLFSAKAELQLLGSYDAVVNNADLEKRLQGVCSKLGYLYQNAETVMTGEDFGFFTTMYPGLLFWLGSGSDKALHAADFLPSEDCIAVGINVMWELMQMSRGI